MISKFSMFENLEQLQAHGSLTDTCLVGASGKVFIHQAMLFADHVQPNPVWYQLDPGEGDGKMVVVVPDASTEDLENFVRKLYCPGAEVFYTAVPNTPDIVPGSPDIYHTAVPQTPLLPPSQPVDSAELDKIEKKHRLDMIKVSLSLLKLQRYEALTKNDKETASNVMRSIDMNNEEKLRLERDLDDIDTHEESSKVKDEVCVDDDNEADPEAEIVNHPGDDDVDLEVEEEIKEEDDDEENNVAQESICTPYLEYFQTVMVGGGPKGKK